MFTGLCHSGNWGSFGNFNLLDGIGLISTLFFSVALLAGLALLTFWALRRARVPEAGAYKASRQPAGSMHYAAKEDLQARYARGEITREE